MIKIKHNTIIVLVSLIITIFYTACSPHQEQKIAHEPRLFESYETCISKVFTSPNKYNSHSICDQYGGLSEELLYLYDYMHGTWYYQDLNGKCGELVFNRDGTTSDSNCIYDLYKTDKSALVGISCVEDNPAPQCKETPENEKDQCLKDHDESLLFFAELKHFSSNLDMSLFDEHPQTKLEFQGWRIIGNSVRDKLHSKTWFRSRSECLLNKHQLDIRKLNDNSIVNPSDNLQ